MNQHYNKPALFYDIAPGSVPTEMGLSAAFKLKYPTVKEALIFVMNGGVPVLRQESTDEVYGAGVVYTPFTLVSVSDFEGQCTFVFKNGPQNMEVTYDLAGSGGGGEPS